MISYFAGVPGGAIAGDYPRERVKFILEQKIMDLLLAT